MTKPLISFAVLLLSIGFAFFYVVPAYNLNKERRGDIESLTKILSTSGEIKTLIEKTKKNLSGIDPSGLSRFESFLPSKIDPIRFANNIQYLGRKNRLVLSDIKIEEPASVSKGGVVAGQVGPVQSVLNTLSIGSKIDQAQGSMDNVPALPGAETGSSKYATTKATFSFSATYETFLLFLADIEKSLGLINLKSLSFSVLPDTSTSKSTKTTTPIYQYVMEIETYSLK